LKQLKMLVADDESLISLSISEQLQGLGHEVIGTAQNGREAIEMAEQYNPDLIIMDIKMPEVDGLKATKVINQRKITPIILLSGYSNEKIAQKAGESGAFAYLTKPVDKRELVPAIEIALSRFHELTNLKKEVSYLEQTIEARKVIERAKGIIMKRYDLSESEAHLRLQKASRDQNIKLVELAKSIIFSERLESGLSVNKRKINK